MLGSNVFQIRTQSTKIYQFEFRKFFLFCVPVWLISGYLCIIEFRIVIVMKIKISPIAIYASFEIKRTFFDHPTTASVLISLIRIIVVIFLWAKRPFYFFWDATSWGQPIWFAWLRQSKRCSCNYVLNQKLYEIHFISNYRVLYMIKIRGLKGAKTLKGFYCFNFNSKIWKNREMLTF